MAEKKVDRLAVLLGRWSVEQMVGGRADWTAGSRDLYSVGKMVCWSELQ